MVCPGFAAVGGGGGGGVSLDKSQMRTSDGNMSHDKRYVHGEQISRLVVLPTLCGYDNRMI
jgi:hypothetical protein